MSRSNASKKSHAKPVSKPQATRTNRAWWFILAGVAVLALGLVLIFGLPGRQAPEAAAPGGAEAVAQLPAEITVADAYTRFNDGAFLLDVRTPEEWNEFHVEGSTLIPLNELAARVNEVPQDREVVVVCRSGNRSQEGRDILRNAGFTQVTSVAGGLTDWRNAGYPTVSGP